MRRRRLSYDERAYIDVVPLVDTLLAVFLFLAILAFQSPMTFLAVKLPFAQEGEKKVLSTMRVQVLKDGSYMYEGKKVSLEELDKQMQTKQPGSLVIEADEDTLHKFVVALMDIAKKEKVQDVIIATRTRR
ncbi:Biopolymer transport protein ExbD/TolR [Hydrogenobacter thermophilus TK-6]|uniref:Biopolymer transport protein ExbD/TolR-type n=1 Tax=Hydrogenobacter thermophilus (strain DSM 6534 / IAM 12695 / TK-6) TaxID=608538 RepID=D3DFG5_HYDTT|nr:biopolymer transporter ExbD [Hydrogenobacter thermophilus]ADO44511.1 Biopolymer transport protein ExbD/TolR [Hydrogenobacter thermophilus TK-6]BAI68567.1 biopolymer transport protein ExbD/TolR-type [Hydrogenobacter thermophilus TK-6]